LTFALSWPAAPPEKPPTTRRRNCDAHLRLANGGATNAHACEQRDTFAAASLAVNACPGLTGFPFPSKPVHHIRACSAEHNGSERQGPIRSSHITA